MAFPNEILVGRLNAVLTKMFSMKEGAPAPVLMPEITAGVTLENDRPEWAYLGGTQLGIGGTEIGAVAGQRAHCEIRNPDDSGILTVVLDAMVSADVSVPFYIGVRRAAELFPGSTNFSTARDTRRGTVQITTIVRAGTLAAADPGRQIVTSGTLGRTFLRVPLVYVLAPGDALICSCRDANTLFQVGWRWYERKLEPSERI